MIAAPTTTFLKLRSYLTDIWISKDTTYEEKALANLHADVTTWAALGSILSIQLVIFLIVLVKYGGDILDVFCRDRGHLEYN